MLCLGPYEEHSKPSGLTHRHQDLGLSWDVSCHLDCARVSGVNWLVRSRVPRHFERLSNQQGTIHCCTERKEEGTWKLRHSQGRRDSSEQE